MLKFSFLRFIKQQLLIIVSWLSNQACWPCLWVVDSYIGLAGLAIAGVVAMLEDPAQG